VGGTVTRVCVDGGQVALGGDFASAGGIEKRGLAAIDLRTGRLAAQQPPDVEVRVDALARTGDVVVAGGGSRLVAFAASNGAPIGNATIVGTVSALAFSDATLYIGGSFASLFGTPRRNLGAIDLLTGRVTAWDPRPADQVTRLIESSGAIYAIGLFQSVPGYGRDGVAAYDTRDGTLLPFSASADGPINDLAFFRDRVMVAGAVSRNIYDAGTKWVDRASGEDVPLGRPVPFLANAVGRSGNTIVVGGPPSPGFSNAGLAAIDAVSGTRLAWSPRLTGVSWPFVQAIAGSTRYVAIGGAFEAVDGRPAQNLVVYPSGRVAAPQRMTTAVSRSTVTLGWQAEPAATGGYVIEAGTAPGAADVGTFAIGNATRATASLPSGTYFVRVSAVGTTGPGLASSEVVVTVPGGSTAPEAPTGLTAVVLDDIVTLRWTAAAGNATTYLIEAATSSAPTTPTAFVTGHLDTTLTTMAPRGSYVVRVRAANAFGVSPPSNEVAVVVP
jgi:hypothetical protein